MPARAVRRPASLIASAPLVLQVVVTVAIMPVATYLFVISAKELEEDMKEDQLFQKVLDDSDDTMKVKNPIPIKNPMLENLD